MTSGEPIELSLTGPGSHRWWRSPRSRVHTIEHGDVGAAVARLAGAPVEVPQKTALGWFDAVSDF